MKKNIFTAGLMAMMSIVAVTSFMKNGLNSANDLLAANIEALAKDDEKDEPKFYFRCTGECKYEFSGPKNSSITVNVPGIGSMTLATNKSGKAYYTSAKGEVRCSRGGDELCIPQNCSAGGGA